MWIVRRACSIANIRSGKRGTNAAIDVACESVLRWTIHPIDHQDVDRRLGGFQPQSKLLLHCRVEIGFPRTVRRLGKLQSTELRVVRRPYQVEIVSALESRTVDHGPI